MPHFAGQLTYLTDMEENSPAATSRRPRFARMSLAVAWGQPEFISTFLSYSVHMAETARPQTGTNRCEDVRGSNFEHD